ncbi:MAG: sodium:proton antiporter [Muribaculaceae bacterium]|nr:sodium:proton antiporter [Muribaculaceae bacterium]
MKSFFTRSTHPSLAVSLLPVLALLCAITALIIIKGAGAVQDYSYWILLGATALCVVLSISLTKRPAKLLAAGIKKSATQIFPAIVILIFIGTLSATWMLSGVVPALIDYGLAVLNPKLFLLSACAICAVVSVITGTSWTTIATIGVAFMGIGTVMGYNPAWIAGAIISGAYFGDKVSPLSDTTVLAAATTGVPLFTHIRFLMLTTIPAMSIALAVYSIVGAFTDTVSAENAIHIRQAIESTFNITPWILVIPGIAAVMIALRWRTDVVLAVSSLAGLAGFFILQPQLVAGICGASAGEYAAGAVRILVTSTEVSTGDSLLDSLVGTSGIEGMLPTIYLVVSAMLFGGVMIGSGMLSTITRTITRHLHSPRNLVSATVGSGLFLNCCTGDQYLSIIIGANVYKSTYKRANVKPQLLGRTLEDSVSVTSVLIPWNSCGLTQSTVLGVATLAYLPFCIFNILSPVMTLIMGWTGWRVRVKPAAISKAAA